MIGLLFSLMAMAEVQTEVRMAGDASWHRQSILLNSGVEKHFTPIDLDSMAQSYDHFRSVLKEVTPSRVENLTICRGVPETVNLPNGETITNTVESVFETHPGVRLANTRLAPPGRKALYTSTGPVGRNVEAWHTLFDEMNASKINIDEPLWFSSKVISSSKVLDLTDTQLMSRLKAQEGGLFDVLKKGDPKNDYLFSHALGEAAHRSGFEAIKINSAVNKTGVNFVILENGL